MRRNEMLALMGGTLLGPFVPKSARAEGIEEWQGAKHESGASDEERSPDYKKTVLEWVGGLTALSPFMRREAKIAALKRYITATGYIRRIEHEAPNPQSTLTEAERNILGTLNSSSEQTLDEIWQVLGSNADQGSLRDPEKGLPSYKALAYKRTRKAMQNTTYDKAATPGPKHFSASELRLDAPTSLEQYRTKFRTYDGIFDSFERAGSPGILPVTLMPPNEVISLQQNLQREFPNPDDLPTAYASKRKRRVYIDMSGGLDTTYYVLSDVFQKLSRNESWVVEW